MTKITIKTPTSAGMLDLTGYPVRTLVAGKPVRVLVHAPLHSPPGSRITEITHIPSGQRMGWGSYSAGAAYLRATGSARGSYTHKEVVEAAMVLLVREHGEAAVVERIAAAQVINK